MAEDDNTASKTYELYGPKKYSMAEIAQLVDKEIIRHRRHLNIPKRLLKPAADLLNRLLWWRIMSADEVEREFIDQEIDHNAKTFKDLGIEPGELANFTFHYLVSGNTSVSNIIIADGEFLIYSNHIEVHLSTTCLQQPSEKKEKKRNFCMSLMINDGSLVIIRSKGVRQGFFQNDMHSSCP